MRHQIGAARRNVELLLRICIPDRRVWVRNGWDGRRIEEVLQHIITDQVRQQLQQKQHQYQQQQQQLNVQNIMAVADGRRDVADSPRYDRGS